MKRDRIDLVLQLGWLESWINTHGAYEKAITRQKNVSVPPMAREALIRRLELTLATTRPTPPLTIGALLRSVRLERLLRSQEMFSRLGVSQNIYRMMERDAISPLKIPASVWKKLMDLLNYPADELAEMLRRTQQLIFYRPSFKGVLARHRKPGPAKRSSLEKAQSELYAKAKLQLPEDQEEKLKKLAAQLKADQQ